VQSARHQRDLAAARDLYEQGRFLDAVSTLRVAARDEPDNLFLLNELARALFRVDSLKPQSRTTYVRLVSLLDAAAPGSSGAVVVDLWFVDAYWKLALLDLDAEDYRDALLQLTKVTLAPHSNANFEEQLYGYLAETFYHLGDRQGARWFADRTLRLNPRNQYVLPFRE
jgi:tetratricopeptide (TPR) repeat protein